MVTRYGEFFPARVYLHFHDLHSVDKRLRDSGKRVCRCYKQTVRKVYRRLYEMVAEVFVLFGVKHFEQSRRRIAVRISRQFIDLVHKYQRIHTLCLSKRGYESARH